MLLSEYMPLHLTQLFKVDADEFENNSITETFNVWIDTLDSVVYTSATVTTLTVNSNEIIFNKVT
jgi:hypothetical protein